MNRTDPTSPADSASESPKSSPVDIDALVEAMAEKGLPLYEARGLNRSHMEAIYSHGYGLYNGGKFKEAEKLFLALCLYDHLSSRNWMALGSAQLLLKKFSEAAYAFSFSGILDPNSPIPPFHAAECYVALGNREAAVQASEAAALLSENSFEHASLHERAIAQKALLQRESQRESHSEVK